MNRACPQEGHRTGAARRARCRAQRRADRAQSTHAASTAPGNDMSGFEAVITSLLGTDLYKPSMWQSMLHHMAGNEAEYCFVCRNAPALPLANLVDEASAGRWRRECRSTAATPASPSPTWSGWTPSSPTSICISPSSSTAPGDTTVVPVLDAASPGFPGDRSGRALAPPCSRRANGEVRPADPRWRPPTAGRLRGQIEAAPCSARSIGEARFAREARDSP